MLRALKANNRSNFDSRPSNCYRCGFWPPGAYNFIENQGLLLICTVYYTGRPVNICPRQTPYLSTLKISWNENNIIFRKFPVLSRWYQKFIGVVSTKIEILFFLKKVSEIKKKKKIKSEPFFVALYARSPAPDICRRPTLVLSSIQSGNNLKV
jgi:hypothetical protein